MTFRKHQQNQHYILLFLFLEGKIIVVSCMVAQGDDVLESLPTNTMRCRNWHAWGVDAGILWIHLFITFQIIKFIFFWREEKQLSSKSAYSVQITNTNH